MVIICIPKAWLLWISKSIDCKLQMVTELCFPTNEYLYYNFINLRNLGIQDLLYKNTLWNFLFSYFLLWW